MAVAGSVRQYVCAVREGKGRRSTGRSRYQRVSRVRRMMTVEWRGKPVWILKRTEEMLSSLKKTDSEVADPNSDVPFTMQTPEYCKNETRSRADHKDLLVVVGICSHLGCSPQVPSAPVPTRNPRLRPRILLCPRHGSILDLAGRVFKNKPAPQNLDVPPYQFLSDTKIVIGKDEKGDA
ncbi:ubiquinol-cytochrome c reductase iron-sulfur subunit [Cupriavidus basilensis]